MRRHRPAERGIEQDITLQWLRKDVPPAAIRACLGYRRGDPFAVTLRFRGSPVVWTFGRELLRRGLEAPAGQGDVAVCPHLDHRGRPAVVIRLCSPDGEIDLEARMADVHRFVSRTLDLVASGCESGLLDLDELVAHLLREDP